MMLMEVREISKIKKSSIIKKFIASFSRCLSKKTGQDTEIPFTVAIAVASLCVRVLHSCNFVHHYGCLLFLFLLVKKSVSSVLYQQGI